MGNACGRLQGTDDAPHFEAVGVRARTPRLGATSKDGVVRASNRETDPTASKYRKDRSMSSIFAVEGGVKPHSDAPAVLPTSHTEPQFSDSDRCSLTRLRRSNSTSSVFVSHTMNAPNNDEALKCLAKVVRYMLRNDARGEPIVLPHFEPTLDQLLVLNENRDKIPSREVVFSFIKTLFVRAQLSDECVVVALCYLQRLRKATRVTLSRTNWRHVVFACFHLASKVWDDLSMINRDFGVVCPGHLFNLAQINKLEADMLALLDWDVLVNAQQYATCYFQLRDIEIQPTGKNRSPRLPQTLLDKEKALKLNMSDSVSSFVGEGSDSPPRVWNPCVMRRKVTCDEDDLLRHPRPLLILS